MNNSLQPQPFQYHGQNVRRVIDKDGKAWVIAKDACDVLEIKNHRDAVARLDRDGVGTTDVIDSLGRRRKAATIDEGGLFELSIISRKPEARKFWKWVTREVLPSIAQTGSYVAPQAPTTAVDLSDPYAVQLQLAQAVIAQSQRAVAAETQLAVAAPKAALADTITASRDRVYSVGRAANLLADQGFTFGKGRNTLFDWLRAHGWVGKYDRSPLQKAVAPDWLRYKYYADDAYEPTTVVTPKGLAKIHELLVKEREADRVAAFRAISPVKPAVSAPRQRRRLPAA